MRAAGVLLASLLVAAALAATGVMEGPERAALDARFDLRGTQPVEGFAIVGIDEQTLTNRRWPFNRRKHALVLDALRRAGARQVVYDVQFTEPSPDFEADKALFAAVERFPGTILATAESDGQGRTAVLGGDDRLARIGAEAAAANMLSDDDGAIRHYERSVNRLDSIATATADRLDRAPADEQALIDFRGPRGTIPTYSFGDVLQGRIDADLLRDRIVVVGATAATLQDIHPTSAPGGQMPGPEIQANAIWTALHGNPLQEAPGWLRTTLALLFSALAAGAVLLVGARRGVALALLLAAAYAGGAHFAFVRGTVLPVAAPLAGLLAGAGIAGAIRAAAVVVERRRTAWRNRELEAAVAARTAELERTQLEVVERLARTAELRDDDTGEHVDRMSRMCERLALTLGWSPERAQTLRRAAVLHDIGKVGLSDGILRKPSRLSAAEVATMRRHTTDGAAILAGSTAPVMQLAECIALTHHERWDGTGYPAGLAGEAIPIEGRIAAVADVYDALISERPYKPAWSAAETLVEIERTSGSHFDPAVVAALLVLLGPPFVADVASEPAVEPAGAPGTVAHRAIGLHQ